MEIVGNNYGKDNTVSPYLKLQPNDQSDYKRERIKTVDELYECTAYIDVRDLGNVEPNVIKRNDKNFKHDNKATAKTLSCLPAANDNISVGQCIISLPETSVVSNLDHGEKIQHHKKKKGNKHEFRKFKKTKSSITHLNEETGQRDYDEKSTVYIDAQTAVKDLSNEKGFVKGEILTSGIQLNSGGKLNHSGCQNLSVDDKSKQSYDSHLLKLETEKLNKSHLKIKSNKVNGALSPRFVDNGDIITIASDHAVKYNLPTAKTHTTNISIANGHAKKEKNYLKPRLDKLNADNCVQEKSNKRVKYQNMDEVNIQDGNMVEMRQKGVKPEQDSASKGVETDDEEFLQWMKNQFVKVAGEDHSIDRQEFKHALGIKNNYFAERFFTLFDIGNSGTIDMTEFINGVTLLAKGTPQQKLKFLFDAYDIDGNGAIDPEELKVVMKHCVEESNMQLSEEALEALTVALFESADADGSGMISFEELCAVLEKHPEVMNNLTISASNWLKPPTNEAERSHCSKCCGPTSKNFNKQYFVNNKKTLIWTIIYILVNIGLFSTCVRYRHTNPAVMIARGCGMCLNFNCSFVLVLMLNSTLTALRMTPMRYFLPIDDNVYYHRCVGYFIVILSLGHTIAHYVNVALAISEDSKNVNSTLGTTEYWEFVLTLKSGVGFVGPGFAYLSGLVLDVVLLVMFICALPCIRRNGYFQVFYFTHLLYIVFWIFLILHGPIFWMFFILPAVVFLIEKLIPPLLRRATGTTFYIKEVNLLPSKVTHLVIHHSKAFHFRPGDYVFIKIPEIAKFEYHPFTISSAPQRKGEFWLHIRSAGHWTGRLYQYFEQYGTEGFSVNTDVGTDGKNNRMSVAPFWRSSIKSRKSRNVQRESTLKVWKNKMKTKKVDIKVSIRGPYGTPTREIFDTEHAVLIASGIGVTPYASILQSIVYEVRHMKKRCPHCSKSFLDMDGQSNDKMKLKKVDFIWINRQHRCFEWFVSLLQLLERKEHEDAAFDNFLDMQMYMTTALSMNDMKGFGLQMAIDAMEKKGQRNVVTGLKQSFKPGRPNWKEVFGEIKKNKKGNVKVFFCGNPSLAKVLKDQSERHGFEFSKESF